MPPLDGSEIVLCTPASALAAELGTLDGFLGPEDGPVVQIVDWLLRPAVWRPRTEDLERDPSWLQIVAYAVLVHDGRVFAYRRARAGQEARLHGRASLGIGGHVNAADVSRPGRPPTPSGWERNILDLALMREVAEEVRPAGEHRYTFAGLLHDPSDPVGSVHLGVVYLVELASPEITPAPEVEPIGWLTPGELASPEHRWESWSQILLPHLSGLLDGSLIKSVT